MVKTVAIIPAAGSGVRMGGDRAKQFLECSGRPLLAMTLEPFQQSRSIDVIIVVVPSNDVDYCLKEIAEKFHFDKIKKVVAGGRRRQDSVRLGLEAIDFDCNRVLIHDGVRPVITVKEIDRIVSAAKNHRAVITGLPAKETVKEVDGNQVVKDTPDRSNIWLIQTPQVFHYSEILSAHKKAHEEGWEESTDDSALIEKMGISVKVIEGSEKNIKVTTLNDLALAEFLLGTLND